MIYFLNKFFVIKKEKLLKTICLANHKGGTGKTSICIAIGSFLALKKNIKVLIIDLDPQGHVAPGFGIDLEYDQHSIADVLSNKEELLNIIVPTPIENLYLAPANIRLSLVNETLYNTFKRERQLKKAIDCMAKNQKFDVILIDCPPSLGPLVENALTLTDYCLIPCEPSSRSIDGLADFTHKIHEVREGELDNRWFVILSRVKKAAKLTNEVITQKLGNYSNRILTAKIYERESINQAQIAGISIFKFPRAHTAINNFENLGEEICVKCQII